MLPTVDITVYHRGYHGDLNETLFVGNVSDEAKKLVHVTWECLEKAIDMGNNNNNIDSIGHWLRNRSKEKIKQNHNRDGYEL